MTHAIRHLRKERRLTLEQLALSSGVSKGYLSKIELFEANPTIKKLNSIAAALGVPPERILPGLVIAPLSGGAESTVWPDDDATVRAKIQQAWEAVRKCRRSLVDVRRPHEHMPARWFRALSRIYAADFLGPVTPADLRADLQQSKKGLYRELDEMEHKLLLRRVRRSGARGVQLEIGPVGLLWVNEEQGLPEDLYPFAEEGFLRFWMKACSWLATSLVTEVSAQEDVEARIAPIAARVRARFETMFRAADSGTVHARAAANMILETLPRDPLNVVREMRERCGRALALVEKANAGQAGAAELYDELQRAADAQPLMQLLGLDEGALLPGVVSLLCIMMRGTLHQVELVEAQLRREREAPPRMAARDPVKERGKGRRATARASTRRRRPLGTESADRS